MVPISARMEELPVQPGLEAAPVARLTCALGRPEGVAKAWMGRE